jgi:hypothetical protein
MALLLGVLISLATLGLIAWVAPGMFTSGGGLLVVSVLAHTIGTAVATVLASPPNRDITSILRVSLVATMCGLLLIAAGAATFAALAYTIPWMFATTGGVIVCCGLGYVASAVLAGRVYPAWNLQARPLALTVAAIASIYLLGLRLVGG